MGETTSVTVLVLAGIITLAGSTLQGSIGIGLGFVAVPLLVLIDPVFVPGPLLLAAMVLTILVSIREHQSIEFKGLSWAISGRITGTVIAIFILGIIPDDKLSLLFGSMILLAVIISLLGFKVLLTNKNLLSTGILSGIMGTTSAIGGVALALIYQDFQGPRLRGTLSGIFVVGTIISLTALAISGRFGWGEIQMAGVLIPGIIVGFFISNYTARFLDKGMIRPAVLIIATLAGVGVILRSLI